MLLHDILTHSIHNMGGSRQIAYCLGNSITYDQLNELSNKLCHCLIDNGVKHGDRVCIYLDKSIDSLIAIFGILKAGAVYVPLDPGAPHNRIIKIINDSHATAVLTTNSKIAPLLEVLPNNIILVLFDKIRSESNLNNMTIWWVSVLEYSEIYKRPKVIETDAAYILYTSGSTGVPKGVVISHRASFVFVEWAYNEFQLLPGEVVANHAPLHFDLSIFDIFATIMGGGTIILIPPNISLFPHNLADLISKAKINVWYSVPSILIKMVLYGRLEHLDFANLRLVLFAGEVFPTKYLQKLIEVIPHASFYNLYGPTETNVCTYYKVDQSKIPDLLPIGYPCPYNEVMLFKEGIMTAVDKNQGILEHDLKEGELCVQGKNVMSGYWGQDSSNILDKNVYHTGDWVKVNTDGQLLYSGRIDGMIKSRGYRIEIEEIESILYTYPDISRCAVIAVPDIEHTNLLYAFIVPNSGIDQGKLLTEKIVKNFCSLYLPRYMVPTFVKFLLEMPETHNGKIDKLKLKELIERVRL